MSAPLYTYFKELLLIYYKYFIRYYKTVINSYIFLYYAKSDFLNLSAELTHEKKENRTKTKQTRFPLG